MERGFTDATLAAYDTQTRMRVGTQLLTAVRHLERAPLVSGPWNREGAVITGSDDDQFLLVTFGSENAFLRLVQEP